MAEEESDLVSTLLSGFHGNSGLASSMSMPTPVHLGGWQEEEEQEEDQEINNGSPAKQAPGSRC